MYHFSVTFTYHWLLLVFIPAIALTCFLHFRIDKRYRRTRNRIISLIFHSVALTLAILCLAGIGFEYDLRNEKNEIILLVDVSDTGEPQAAARDSTVETILSYNRDEKLSVGVVTFGFGQNYAVPLTDEFEGIYEAYLNAELPDVTGTDIAAAITYAGTLFNYPETGKIVLITDGKETDEAAGSVIASIVSRGISLDVVYIPSAYEGSDVQVSGISLPDYHLSVGEECEIAVTINSTDSFVQGNAEISLALTDNGETDAYGIQTVSLGGGEQTVVFKHAFADKGLHEIAVRTMNGDMLSQNDSYVSYLYLNDFNKVLILESAEGQSQQLAEILAEGGAYDVTVVNVYEDSENMPRSVNDLRVYDQVILNNISNYDLNCDEKSYPSNPNVADGFDDMLYSYVYEYGGGLFTVGGSDEYGEANAYNRSDLNNTTLQEILPVQAITYTPPVGVMVIMDISGSMGVTDKDGVTYLEWAKVGCVSALDALTERDYFGIMTLSTNYDIVLPLTRRSQETTILKAIDGIDGNGATIFPEAIDRAGQALRAQKEVERRHIIVITDGQVPDEQLEQYEDVIRTYYERDAITVSVVVIGMEKDAGYGENPEDTPLESLNKSNLTSYEKMLRAVIIGHGKLYAMKDAKEVQYNMREDLNMESIKSVNYETFHPCVYKENSPLLSGLTYSEEDAGRLNVTLDGFYGVKIKTGAELILTGDYGVPVYAQWKFGLGMVGSFMCDLDGTWSAGFIADTDGRTFIRNVVNNLMPMESVRYSSLSVRMKEYNYINQLSVYSSLREGERITAQITCLSEEGSPVVSLNEITDARQNENAFLYTTAALSEGNNYSRCSFVAKRAGVYQIEFLLVDGEGTVLDSYSIFKTFSYSAEYDNFLEKTDGEYAAAMANLAARAGGAVVADNEDPFEIFEGFQPYIHRAYDPRLPFMIVVIVLFLADIAVRKFKFKWIHELLRERRQGKKQKEGVALS